jgi:phage regulator Rha-like protein
MTSISASVPCVSASPLPVPVNSVIQIVDGMPMVSSKDLALCFQKKHKHVLEEIERLRTFLPREVYLSDFRLISVSTDLGHAIRKDKAYLLSERAFYAISTGFTGRAATLRRWELVSAFLFYKDAYYDRERENLSAQVIEARRRTAALETDVEQVRREALAEGAKVAYKLTPSSKRLMRRALYYKGKGLGVRNSAKLLDVHGRQVATLLKAAATLGLEAQHGTQQTQ